MTKLLSLRAGGFEIEPVSSRRTVQDGVYQRLSEALMSGRIEPGQHFTIASIAEMCGTSHMPVREALRRLAGENALEVASTGSAFVPPASRGRLDDLCDARVIVESAAAARAATIVPEQTIQQMNTIIGAYFEAARAHDFAGMTSLNREFHFTLYHGSNSPVLVRLIETLWLQFGPYLHLLTRRIEPSLKPLEPDTYTRHHFDIIEALRARNARAVGKSVAADINATRTILCKLCDESALKSA